MLVENIIFERFEVLILRIMFRGTTRHVLKAPSKSTQNHISGVLHNILHRYMYVVLVGLDMR